MTTFIQIHTLQTFPACNLNRGDDGRPKDARVRWRRAHTLQLAGSEIRTAQQPGIAQNTWRRVWQANQISGARYSQTSGRTEQGVG